MIGAKDYVPSTKTAPYFDLSTDVKSDGTGPDCWMYIYFQGTGAFVRTSFSKSGNVNSGILTGNDGTARVYTKGN